MNTKPRVTRRTLLASAAASPMAAPVQASSQPQYRSAQLTPVGVAAAATITAPACTTTDPLAPLEPALSQFTSARTTLQSTRPLSQRLDIGIDFSETVLNQPDNNEFRYHQVEQLISQAATLLERGIASRSEWQNLYERYFATYLELKEFDDLDAIHADETLHGFYALAQMAAETDYDVQTIMLTGWGNTVTSGADTSAYANAQKDSTNAQKFNADFRKGYEQCNVGFRRRRTESARRMNV